MSDSAPFAFPTTDWSQVTRAAGKSSDSRNAALTSLVQRYLPAMTWYLRRKHKLDTESAEELVQDFFVKKVLEQEFLRHADRSRGRFRNFLMTALDRFVLDESRRERTTKRFPQAATPLSQAVESITDPSLSAADVFDIAWARQVLDLAVRRMREECETSGRADVWGVFEARVLAPVLERRPPSYDELVSRFGFASPEQASNIMVTAKRMFLRHLRAVVREYADDEAHVDEEIRLLRSILSSGRA